MSRRAVLWVGAAAAAVGLGAALWRARQCDAISAESSANAPETTSLWTLRLPSPDGSELALARFRGRPLLVNFWATWCPPCIREMPEIDRFARQFAATGWQVLGLAADQDKPVREYLSRNPVSYPIALAGFEGIQLSRQLGNTGGALPFTVALDAAGSVTQRHLGETRFELLSSWAQAGPAGGSKPP